MKNSIDLEARFEDIFKPLFEAGKEHMDAADKLCLKIDKSNGQICRALRGMVASNGSAQAIHVKVKK